MTIGNHMTILQTNSLTDEQVRDIRELERICTEADSANPRISLDNGINFVREMDCFFLMYEDGALIGLISVFAPKQDEAEVSGCVHPAHRRQGVFNRLLSQACVVLRQCGYEKLLFVHEASAPDGMAIAQKWGLGIEHSEYLLHYTGDVAPAEPGGLEVRLARVDDIPEMVRLSAETFGETDEDAQHLVESALQDEQRHLFAAFADGAMVGICGVNTGDPELYIFGFGITPRSQNKGLGRRVLAQVISATQKMDSREIVLEVDSENARAFHLYKTSGFTVRTQYDYYEAQTVDYILPESAIE